VKWFSAKKAGLNLGKTNITIFIANNSPHTEQCIIRGVQKINFLCLQVDNRLQWKIYID
jgi:hypothetical protein